MKRAKFVLWVLLLLQVVPLLLIIAAGAGILDPLGVFIEQSVSSPIQGGWPRFVVNATRFVTFWWFVVCLWLMGLGALAAFVCVAFDQTLTKLERLVWAAGFAVGHSVTIILYCVLKLLRAYTQQQQAVA